MLLGSLPLLLATLSTWLTPPWLIGAGAGAGLLILAIVYGLARLTSRPLTTFFNDSLREGFLTPVLVLAAIMAVGAAVSSLVVPVRDLTRSMTRLVASHNLDVAESIPPDGQEHHLTLSFRPAELESFTIDSDRDLVVRFSEYGIIKEARERRVDVAGGEPWQWTKTDNNLFYGASSEMNVRNLSKDEAHLRLTGATNPEYPQVAAAPRTALALVGLVLAFLGLKWLAPKIMAIALATSREITAAPLFQVVMALGIFGIILYVFIPQNTFGEDVKMLKISVFPMIRTMAIIVAVWSASESISNEIEGRTAMTVLSKPIGRRQFLIGKFVGILLPVALLFLYMGALFMLTVSYKVVYDAREGAELEPLWQACFEPMITTVPGLLLNFFEAVMLTAVAVALSTRLPLLANLIVCATVFVLGHLVPLLVMSRVADSYGIVRFMGQLIAAVLPVLDHFETEAAISAGLPIPLPYLAMAFGYCLLYSTVAMLLALTLFEDRDLA